MWRMGQGERERERARGNLHFTDRLTVQLEPIAEKPCRLVAREGASGHLFLNCHSVPNAHANGHRGE